MADLGLESLAEADRVHREANAEFDRLWGELEEAGFKESDTGEERLNTYERVFLGGFIIKAVIDPQGIKYRPGYYDDGMPGPTKWEVLDEQHRQKLIGAFATSVRTSLVYGRHISIEPSLEHTPAEINDVTVQFRILGVFDNEGYDRDVMPTYPSFHPDHPYEKITEYTARIPALDIRLPSEEDRADLRDQAERSGLELDHHTYDPDFGPKLMLREATVEARTRS